MAKLIRKSVGSLYRSKDADKPNYIKIRDDITLKAGQYVMAESQKFQLASINKAAESGKLSGENLEKALKRAENIPDYVIAELVVLEESKG